MVKNKSRKYSPATVLLSLLSALGIALFYLPSFGGNVSSSFLNILAEKNIYSAAIILLAALPIVIIFVTSLFPADVIKKYVVSFFISLWLCLGYIMLFVLMKAKYSEAMPSFGMLLGIADTVLILACTILGNITDKSSREHKDLVWYNGFNKIILFISLPLFVSMTLGMVFFCKMVFSFPVLTVIGIFALWASLGICAYVSVSTLLGKYKSGIMYYITAFTVVIAIMGMFLFADFLTVLFALIVSAALAAFFTYLGNIAKKNFF